MARPSLEEFGGILDILAKDPRGPENSTDFGYADWVRSGISAAGTKLRVLRYLLEHRLRERRPRLLDVGAGVGSLAAYAAKLGFAATAVDLEHNVRRFHGMLASMDVDYRSCDLGSEALPFADGSFDFVTYLDTIEHHAFSPKRVLTETHRVLIPGGRLFVTTPNHASIFNRVALLFGRNVNDDFSYFFDSCADRHLYPGHHREYTLRELRAALKRTAFRVVHTEVTDEDPSAVLRGIRYQPTISPLPLGLAVVGKGCSVLRLRLGRILLVVGEKVAGSRS